MSRGGPVPLSGSRAGRPARSPRIALGLTPVAVETWEDFVFINLAPEPPEALREFLGSYYDGFHGYPFAEMTTRYRFRGVVHANWKIVRDAFLETYHFPVLHRYTFAGASPTRRRTPTATTSTPGPTGITASPRPT